MKYFFYQFILLGLFIFEMLPLRTFHARFTFRISKSYFDKQFSGFVKQKEIEVILINKN